MSLRPNYIFLYQNDYAIKSIMREFPFDCEKPVKIQKSKDFVRIEYEHFDLRCIKIYNSIGDNLRGYRTWGILIEDKLYMETKQKAIDQILKPILCPFYKLGGNIVPIRCKEE